MKKLLSILLVLVMAFALTAPAFADGSAPGAAPYEKTDDTLLISPAPDDARDNGWAKAKWAELCEAQPERTARFLEELDGWFAEEYPYYDSFAQFCAYCSCAEEAYVELFEVWSWEYARQQARDAFITAHGGVPGQLNVMVNGTFLSSPAERPAYEEDGVTYADAQALSQALGVPVTASEAGYAPVRATAEAIGCQVAWDDTYNAAVVIDPAALAAEIDANFTCFNRVLSSQVPARSNCLLSGTADTDLTVFNSLDGDRTHQFSIAYDLHFSDSGVSGVVDYDFSLLWELFQEYIPMPLETDREEAQLALLTTLLSGSVQVRVDAQSQMAYFSLPALMPSAWFSASLEDMELEALIEQLSNRPSSMGELICRSALDSYIDPVRLYDTALESANQAALLLGDEKFVPDGNARVLTLTADDIYAVVPMEDTDLSFSVFSYTLRLEENNDLKVDGRFRIAMKSDGLNLGDVLQFTVSAAKTGDKTRTTTQLHVRNLFKMTVKQEQTLSAAQDAPVLAPPQGALILDIEKVSEAFGG